jgi:hypothetical protein
MRGLFNEARASIGNSSRQGGHQLAQKETRRNSSFRFFPVYGFPAASTAEIRGAREPFSGEEKTLLTQFPGC